MPARVPVPRGSATLYGSGFSFPWRGSPSGVPIRGPPFHGSRAALVAVHLAYVFYLAATTSSSVSGPDLAPRQCLRRWGSCASGRSLREGSLRCHHDGLEIALSAWNAVPLLAGFQDNEETFSVKRRPASAASGDGMGEWFRENAAPDEVLAVRPPG